MMRRLSAARAACLCGVLLSCRTETDAQRRSVLTEFRAAAVDQGWLLAHFNRAGAIVLRPETGARRDMPTAPGYRIYQFASSASGSCLAFSVDAYALTPGMAGGSIYVLDRNGLRGPAEGFFTVIKGLAVDPGCTKVSIDGVYQEVDAGGSPRKAARAGLFYTDLPPGGGTVRLVSRLDDVHVYLTPTGVSDDVFEASWSADGKTLAYSVGGAIYAYDVAAAKSRLLVTGTVPAWSPDGKWIGYRGPDNAPMLFDPVSRQSQSLHEGAHCLWSIKWSPDSKFAIFTQPDWSGVAFIACRLRDRATAAFYRSGGLQFREDRFAWVTRPLLEALLAPGARLDDQQHGGSRGGSATMPHQ